MARRKYVQTTSSWSFLLILIFAVLALGFLIIYWSIQRPFCASSDNCDQSMKLNVENNVSGIFNNQKVIPPKIDLARADATTDVLGEATGLGEKHIYVDLTSQKLSAFQGDTMFMQAPVSTGKWHPTPTGEFTIWEKLRATKMSGGEGADYYYLPNVPYVMFFSGPGAPAGAGFSLHGAYWHDNFGHPMSHGCVNMRTVDAQKLYDWANPTTNGGITPATSDNPGTKITIYGQAPI
ncbi:MAG TPA: L,D-transpeptidase [Patescibacteria group bacterium]|nr:L,D-transpeptidase [Patescibacteria group bacterium]